MTAFSVVVEVTKCIAALVSDCMACPTSDRHLSFDTTVVLDIHQALEIYQMDVVIWLVTVESIGVLVLMVLFGTKQFLYVFPATIQNWSELVVFPCYLAMISLDGWVYVEVPGRNTSCAPAEISVVAADVADVDAAAVHISVDPADNAVDHAAAFQNSVVAVEIVDDHVSVVQLSVVSADGAVDDNAAFQKKNCR